MLSTTTGFNKKYFYFINRKTKTVYDKEKAVYIQDDYNESITFVNKTYCFHAHSLPIFFSFCSAEVHVNVSHDIKPFFYIVTRIRLSFCRRVFCVFLIKLVL